MELMVENLSQAIGSEAFKLFTNPKFRNLCLFDTISQLEQDLIFNEFVIAVVTVMMLTCDAPDISDERKALLSKFKDQIAKSYTNQLKSLGVERKFLKQWDQLIEMRYQEYTHDKSMAREAAFEVESGYGEIYLKKLSEIQMMLPLQTVAIGCHRHICRSKTDGRDELFKLILRWLGEFYVEFRVSAEGKSIHPLSRLKVKLRRWFNSKNRVK
ncbi:MAG: hypothetical protein AAB768_02490 [Patescibacteria group bacterium]